MKDSLVKRSIGLMIFINIVLLWLPTSAYAGGFSAGNIVVYRVGTGAEALVNTGNVVYIDEYTGAGVLVQSLALPATAAGNQAQLIASGTASSEGLLTRSADGRYLFLTGYAANTGGGASLSTTGTITVSRTVGRMDWNGAIDTSTALTDFASNNNPRSAVSSDGNDIWVAGGAGGIRFTTFGVITSTQINTIGNNFRQLNIFDNQLYVSTSSGTALRLGVVGAGLPITGGQVITALPGIPIATPVSAPFAYFFADLDAGVAGVDTLYVADDGILALSKYSLAGGNWTRNGTVGVDLDDYRGLTGIVNGSTVILYATRKGGTGPIGGGELVAVIDHSGYNGVLNATPFVLATAAANTAMRGVALAPVAAGVAAEIAVFGNDRAIDKGDGTPDRADASHLGSVEVVGASALQTYTIRNTGNAALAISDITLSGSEASDFRISDIVTPTTVEANSSITFAVTFDPTARGVRSATLSIANNDRDENSYAFMIQGVGLAPEAGMAGNGQLIASGDALPDAVDGTDFALVTVGQTITHSFTLSNAGNLDLLINDLALSGGGAGAFRLAGIVTPTTLSAGASANFQIAFAPSASGVFNALLAINSNDSDENPYLVNVQGEGVTPEIDVQGNTRSIVNGDATPELADDTDFAGVNLQESSTHIFIIKNSGLGDLTIGNLSLGGGAAGDFAVSGIVTPALLTANATMPFQVTFTPAAAGLRSATVTVANSDGDESLYTFAIQGVGLAAEVDVLGNGQSIASGDSSPSLADNTDFGSVTIGQAVTRSFTISNSGNTSLTISGLTLNGADAFHFVDSAVSGVAGANSTLTLQVYFAPTLAGVQSAMISFASNDSDEAIYTFTIQGAGAKIEQSLSFLPPADTIYGAAPLTLAAASSSNLPVNFTLISGPATLNDAVLTFTSAGVVMVRAAQAGNDIYQPALSVERSINVAKAPLTITVDNKVIMAGSALPTLTAVYSGFVNGETAANLDTPLTLSTAATAGSPPGAYPITASKAADTNYAIIFVNGTLTIVTRSPIYLPIIAR